MGRKKVHVPEQEAGISDGGAGSENISQYWKNFFTRRPDLLGVRSNDEAIAQWKADHPGEREVSRSAMNGLTNVKSQMRSTQGVKPGKRKRGRPRKHARAEAVAAPAARVARAPTKVLEALEDQIDKCLHLITGQDGLGKIVQTLKQARRLTILEIGE